MTSGTVDVDVADRVAVITMNRPEKRNALSVAFLAAVVAAVVAADADATVDVLILTGADPAFCAGLDLEEIGANGGALRGAVDGSASSPWPALTKPLIGAVNGVAVTGGFELALNCDFLVASDRARFGDTHARVGVMPGWGMSVLLPRRIGFPRALEMSLTGNFIEADEALRLGLVNHVVPHAELLPTARALALDIAGTDQRTIRTLLASIRRIADVDGQDAALAVERETSRAWAKSIDPTEVGARRAAVMERGRATRR